MAVKYQRQRVPTEEVGTRDLTPEEESWAWEQLKARAREYADIRCLGFTGTERARRWQQAYVSVIRDVTGKTVIPEHYGAQVAGVPIEGRSKAFGDSLLNMGRVMDCIVTCDMRCFWKCKSYYFRFDIYGYNDCHMECFDPCVQSCVARGGVAPPAPAERRP